MLTRETPETIKASVTVNCAGQKLPLMLTYYNRATDALVEFTNGDALKNIPDEHKANPFPWMNMQVCMYLIKSFDDGTDKEFPLNAEGLLDMESHYPGVLKEPIGYFHVARQASVEKN